jgi:PAS domain S-box-containing protein
MTEQTPRVLIVCADPERRESMARSLDGNGRYSVRPADGVRQALELLSNAGVSPDFMVIDADLASNGGGGVIRDLMETAAARRPPVDVVLLADASAPGGRQAWLEDFRSPLTTCSTAAQLPAHIQRVLEGRRPARPLPSRFALDVLAGTNAALHAPREEGEALPRILEGVRAVGFDRVRLYVMSDDGSEMSVAAHVGMPESFAGTRLESPASLRTFFTTPSPQMVKAGAAGPLGFEPFLEPGGVREWVCTPLLQKNQLIGIISADTSESGRPLAEEDLLPLPLFAAQARTALELDLASEIEKQVQTLQSVLEIYCSISSTLRLDNILSTACRCALQLVRADQCWLMLFEEGLEKGRLRSCSPKGLLVPGSEISLARSAIRDKLVVSKSPLVVPSLEDFGEQGGDLGELGELLRESDVRSCLLVPVISKGLVIGAFGLDSIGRERTFSHDEIVLCQVFAAQLAVAMENANLYSATASQAGQLESLRQMMMAITSAQRRDELLQMIIEDAKRLLSGESCAIYECDEQGARKLIAGRERQGGAGEGAEEAPGSFLEVPLRLKNRTAGFLRIDAKPDRRFTQDERRILGLFADQAAIAIDKAKLVEQLNEQRNLRESLVANMPNGIIAVDADGRVILANARAWQILGYEAGDERPSDVNQVYYDPDESCIINKKLASAGGKGMQYLTFARAKDGSAIPIRLYVSVLAGAGDEPKGSVGYFEDLRCDDRTELLLEACGAVAQADTVHNGLQLLAKMLLKLLPAAFCRILLLDDSGRYLTIEAAEAAPRAGEPLDWQDRRGQRLKIDEYEDLRKILEGSEPKVVRACKDRSRPWLEKYSEWLNLKSTVQSLLLVPLRVGETVVGLLSLGELRKEERCPFTGDKSDLAAKIAGQVAALIDRRRLQEADGRRSELLNAMTERAPHIRGDKEPKKLMQEFVRLAVEIVGYKAAGLYIYHSKQDTLELDCTYPAAASAFTQKYLAQVEGFAKRVARARESSAVNECSDLTSRSALLRNGVNGVLFVPLKLSTGEVEAVLFAVNDEARPRFAELELEALNHFTELTSSALQTSRSMDLNQRMLGKLSLLHQLSDYAQEKQDVGRARDALLTCITGGYGLGFNRAVIIEREEKAFRGVCGVGHVNVADARESWKADHKNDLYNFTSYVSALDAGVTFSTPVGDGIRGFHYAVPEAGGDVFSQVLRERKPRTLKADELHELPGPFLELFQPETDVVLIPFVARGQAKGIIVADNKFTQGPITNDDVESLLTFANTVAIAIDNIELFGRVQAGRQRLEHLQGAVESMARSSSATVEVLNQIVDRARTVLHAHSAALWRFDATRDCFIREGYVASNIPDELMVEFIKTGPRPGGTAYTVMSKGWLEVEDIADEGRYGLLGESTRGLLTKLGVSSFIGLALVEGDERLGVLYVNYDHPLRLSEDELGVARTFANYAAVALKQATLADQMGKAFEQLNKAHAASRVVAEVTTLGEPRESLRSVVIGTKRALDCDAVTLYTYDDDRKEFDYPPEMVGVLDKDAVTKLGRVTEESVVRVVLNLDRLYVAQDAPNDELLGKAFARREGVKSSVATRLTALGRPVGVMFVNFRTPHEFTEHELTSIDLFAKQAAVAIHNKQLYEQQKKRAERLQILHEAGRDITSSLDLKETLGRIAKQASRLASYKDRDANFVDIKLIEGTKVRLAAAFPEGEEIRIHERLGEEIDLNVGVDGRIGVIGRAIKEGAPQCVGNVHADPDYVGLDEGTKSQIVVLIKKNENVIGVISAEHQCFNAFDDETLQTLESLAAQASIAIENAKHFDELVQAKTQVDAQTSLALMSMASTIWRHDITGSADIIVARLDSLSQLSTADFSPAQREHLEEIRRQALSIYEQPVAVYITPENAKALAINRWVRERLEVLRGYRHYQAVEFRSELAEDDSLAVLIHKEWLRPVFDIPVDNAVRAMETCDTKCLLVTTGLRDGWVEITFTDTGRGIPSEEMSSLTLTRIVKPQKEKGLGVGLLMAKTILKAYGGDIKVDKTSTEGTTIRIRLPAAL